MSRPLVSFVIPTLNEEEGVGETIDMIDRDAFDRAGLDLEIVVVDGESTDQTRTVATARGARVIREPRKGYGRAYKTGFAEAQGEIIVTGDADATYPFDRAHQFVIDALEQDLDFVTCDRYADLGPGAMKAMHRLGNFVLSTTARVLFGVRLRDSQSGMWIIRKPALAHLHIDALPDGMAFSQEIKIEAIRSKEVRSLEAPGSLRERTGDAKIDSWGDGFGNLKALWKRRFTRR